MGTSRALCRNFPLPRPPRDQLQHPSIVFVWSTFLLSYSPLLPLPMPSNNTHHHRHRKKRELPASGPNEVTIQRYPGNWEPADCPGEPCPSFYLLSRFLFPLGNHPELQFPNCFMHSTHRFSAPNYVSKHKEVLRTHSRLLLRSNTKR